MPIKIDKGVPLPRPNAGRGKWQRTLYPWNEMEVGDSFFLPERKAKSFSPILSKVNRAKAPKRFTLRKTKEDGKEGIRIWRAPDVTNGAESKPEGGEAGQ